MGNNPSNPFASFKVVGFDPSLRNWGIAEGNLFPNSPKPISIYKLSVVNAVLPTGKQVRQNSLDLETAKQLYAAAFEAAKGAKAIFVEVPVGSQSARAMCSYGVCVGVLGALRASGIPFFEVTANEVKMSGAGNKNATKLDMINWAMKQHPEVSWPMHKKKGETLVTLGEAEHMADAIGAIYAGINGDLFKQSLQLMQNS